MKSWLYRLKKSLFTLDASLGSPFSVFRHSNNTPNGDFWHSFPQSPDGRGEHPRTGIDREPREGRIIDSGHIRRGGASSWTAASFLPRIPGRRIIRTEEDFHGKENPAHRQIKGKRQISAFPAENSPSGGGQPGKNLPPSRIWLWFLAVLAVNYLVASLLTPAPKEPVNIPYTLFREETAKGNVHAIYNRGEIVWGDFRNPVTYPGAGTETGPSGSGAKAVTLFTTTLPAFVDSGLEAFLLSHGVEISAKPMHEERSAWETLLYGFGPGLLFILFYFWLFRRSASQGGMGGLMGLGKSKARRYDQEGEEKVTFNDVAGIDEAENELVEIVDFLKDPEKYTRLGGTAPKGILLVGAPGTGKTLLAKAVAGEAGVPFYSMSAAEFVEMIVGVGSGKGAGSFQPGTEKRARHHFIDELDAIGRARGQVSIGGSSEQEQTLNQILTEMDGFSSRTGVIVLAATNQPDVLDKALLRPGRFDRRVVVNLPDRPGREAILKVHTRNVPLSGETSLDEIAATTQGFSGADLKNLVNEAALLAARRGQDSVTAKDFLDALEKIVLGPERPLLLSTEDRERVAYHEGGHAILGLTVPGADPVHRVTIMPRGQALGVTYQRPVSDRYSYPKPISGHGS